MGTITRLYKGKWRKGMCSNERGIRGSNTKIGCLLWMDDVLLMADNDKDL